jgi:hypothetical protein
MLNKLFLGIVKKHVIKQVFGKQYKTEEELKSHVCTVIQSQRRVPGELRRGLCAAVSVMHIDMDGSIEEQILSIF